MEDGRGRPRTRDPGPGTQYFHTNPKQVDKTLDTPVPLLHPWSSVANLHFFGVSPYFLFSPRDILT